MYSSDKVNGTWPSVQQLQHRQSLRNTDMHKKCLQVYISVDEAFFFNACFHTYLWLIMMLYHIANRALLVFVGFEKKIFSMFNYMLLAG